MRDAFRDSIEKETDVAALIEFVKSHDCRETDQYYEEITKGRDLVYMPVPGHRDEEIALPIDVSPDEFFRESNQQTERWLETKKRAVDRLLELDIDAAASLMGCFCGRVIDYHLRAGLVSKQAAYRGIVRRDLEQFAVETLGLSRIPIVRLFQERRIRRRMKERRVHHRYLVDYQYYRQVKDMLGLTIRGD
jgi:hypothetical protein